MRKSNRLFLFLLLLMAFLNSPQALSEGIQPAAPGEAPCHDTSSATASSSSAILYDMSHNTILYEKNATQRSEPGSLTKLLTVLTACTYQGDAIRYTVGDEIDLIGHNSSIAYLRKGDVLSFEAIVDAVLLSSGNDATYTLVVNLARHLWGGHLTDAEALAHYAGLMNEVAQSIGCADSHFVTVDGYPDASHYTTPADMLRIAIASASNDTMARSMAKRRAYHVLHSGRDLVWETTNKLLTQGSGYHYAYATGMKTGSTSSTDYSLAASAEKDGTTLIAIILGTPSDGARFSEAIALFESAFE